MKVKTPKEGVRDYLTPGKVYDTFRVREKSFLIVDDEGDTIYCLFEHCQHLNLQDWIIVEENMNLEQNIERMEEELQEMREKLQASKVSEWEPEGGKWYISGEGELFNGVSTRACRIFGTERKTKELAQKARDKMRVFKRLLAYVDEACGGHDFKLNTENYHIYYSHSDGVWRTWYGKSSEGLGTVYMPEHVAKELCEKLNSGEVKL